MKLLHKSSLYYVILLVPILVVSGFILHNIINYEINKDTDYYLRNQMRMIERQAQELDFVRQQFPNVDDELLIKPLVGIPSYKVIFSDTLMGRGKHRIHFRKMKTFFKVNDRFYEVQIMHSKVRDEEIVESISHSLIITFVLLLLGLLTINGILSKRLWRPFYQSLAQLERLSFTAKEPHKFGGSSTREFDELDGSLNKMTAKMFKDYHSQKQFTENASHELQTPLAVIKAKTDLLLQSNTASEDDMILIADIESSVNKLTHLNRSLLLLSKLENRQFDLSIPLSIQELVEKILSNFDDRLQMKQIQVTKRYLDNVTLTVNALTAEILFSNLIQNAIRYNTDTDGIIALELTKDFLRISNSGPELNGDPQRIFGRFTKFNSSSDSTGLGLAIVKQICEYYSFKISYKFESNLHHFTIVFQNDQISS